MTEKYPHWTCRTHGDFDARVAVGCPECVREMRTELKAQADEIERLAATVERLTVDVNQVHNKLTTAYLDLDEAEARATAAETREAAISGPSDTPATPQEP